MSEAIKLFQYNTLGALMAGLYGGTLTVRVLNSYKYPSYAPCTYFLADVFQDSFMDSNRSISRSSSA